MKIKSIFGIFLSVIITINICAPLAFANSSLAIYGFDFTKSAENFKNINGTASIISQDKLGLHILSKDEKGASIYKNDLQMSTKDIKAIAVNYSSFGVSGVQFIVTTAVESYVKTATIKANENNMYTANVDFNINADSNITAIEVVFIGVKVGSEIVANKVQIFGDADKYSFGLSKKRLEFDKNSTNISPYQKSVKLGNVVDSTIPITVLDSSKAGVEIANLFVNASETSYIVAKVRAKNATAITMQAQIKDKWEQEKTLLIPNEYTTAVLPITALNGDINRVRLLFEGSVENEIIDIDYVRFIERKKSEDKKIVFDTNNIENAEVPASYEENKFIDLPQKYVSTDGKKVKYFTDPELDLGVQTTQYGAFTKTPVNTSPRLVAGEGKYSKNYTVVRVYNEYQAMVQQFLAYPSSVRGGVQVASITKDDKTYIVTAPYSNQNSEIRVFDTEGLLIHSFTPEGITPPYSIVSGVFASDTQLLAIVSKSGDGLIKLFNIEGKEINNFENPIKGDSVTLDKIGGTVDALTVFGDNSKSFATIDTVSKEVDVKESSKSDVTGIYPSAFGGYIGTKNDKDMSYIYQMENDLIGKLVNVGEKENKFWTVALDYTGKNFVDGAPFVHKRVEFDNEYFMTLDGDVNKLLSNDYDKWSKMWQDSMSADYKSKPMWWEPTYTHRMQGIPSILAMKDVVDNETGLPRYFSIGRKNDIGGYTEFTASYNTMTYAPNVPEVEKLFVWSLRATLRNLAENYRGEGGLPENLVGLAPVHEQEINVPGSVGDYHPNMIKGFASHLIEIYGSVERLNKVCGTNFASQDEIDPPRNLNRGEWDTYGSKGGEFFLQWVYYNRTIVNRWLMKAYREALLAGFPPDVIHGHSIPEGDAVAGFLGESDTRISPIDVILGCGTAYGGTRYGIFYNNPNNFIAAARSGGHTNIGIGEYNALTKDVDQAYEQAKYLFNNGVMYIHEMLGFNYEEGKKATERLRDENIPRTASTGSTEKVIPISNKSTYNIVQIATNDDKVGLLKSIDKNGKFDGTVYISPFHAKVGIDPILEGYSEKLANSQQLKSKKIKDLLYGDKVEIVVKASSANNGTLDLDFFKNNVSQKGAKHSFQLTATPQEFVYTFNNENTIEQLDVLLTANGGDVSIDDLSIIVHKEQSPKAYYGVSLGESYRGEVSFDILDREYLYKKESIAAKTTKQD